VSACFDDVSSIEPDSVLLKPHSIQVMIILHLFGCGTDRVINVESKLVQVGTGEGKPILLGGCAAVLALLGFKL